MKVFYFLLKVLIFDDSLFALNSLNHSVRHFENCESNLGIMRTEKNLCTNNWEIFFFCHNNIGYRFPQIILWEINIIRRNIPFFENIINQYRTDSVYFSSSSLFYVDFFFILLIFDISENLLEYIFHRNYSGGTSMFIEHESNMPTRPLEFFKKFIQYICHWYFHNLLQ